MIDYEKPDDDPIVAEVRRARETVSARYKHDLNAVFAEMERRQETGGKKYVTPPPRRARPKSKAG
jgi:hypothetical protein